MSACLLSGMAQTSAQARAFRILVPPRTRTEDGGNRSHNLGAHLTSHSNRVESLRPQPQNQQAAGSSDHSIAERGCLLGLAIARLSQMACRAALPRMWSPSSSPSLGLITEQNVAFCTALINETALLYGSEIKGDSLHFKCCLRHTGKNSSQKGPQD